MQRLGSSRLSRVECESRGTTILLLGTTSTYYQKQLAQTIAGKVPGVHHVINQLRVIDAHPTL
ncbi:BON domain protein [Symmachiella macrocystis]|uniref:BON domain protein n=2 Tax=Symmachiella macrocystis TaxID=2527985 RepID=A0A5C6BV03_9PLAN|nr:BON domain protein [Symmachiella macrocystis]